MKFLRNKEVKWKSCVFWGISAFFLAAAYYLELGSFLPAAGALAVLYLLYLLDLKQRYRQMEELTYEIDRVLDSKSTAELKDFHEGELSVLQNEIGKLAVRLLKQSELLEREKRYLADSMADISHQLRTPMTAIHLLVSRISDPDLSEPQRRVYLRGLRTQLSRTEWLVESLLKLSRLDSGTVIMKEERVDCRELVLKAAQPVQIAMELAEQELTVRGEGNYLGDFAWSCEAVGNVIKNCTEHLGRGGKIEVTIAENGLYTQIEIRDTGKGFCGEDLPHLFERFYKGKNASEQSVGIGLALAAQITAGQKGVLRAFNHPGGGACFQFKFYKSAV